MRDSLSDAVKESKFFRANHKNLHRANDKIYESAKKGHVPLMIGGDHSLAMGSISGVAKHYKEQNQDIGVIWVDAHGDINTPDSSESGNIHGMPLATLLGDGHADLFKSWL